MKEMGVRLVRDDGNVFWLTGSNWRRLLWFASHYGWRWDQARIQRHDGLMNDKYEFIGCARFDEDAAQLLADAVQRGTHADPTPHYLVKDLDRNAQAIREKLPDFDPASHAEDLVQRWAEFAEFARKGGFRVDLTD
jgi:hypothetical protein